MLLNFHRVWFLIFHYYLKTFRSLHRIGADERKTLWKNNGRMSTTKLRCHGGKFIIIVMAWHCIPQWWWKTKEDLLPFKCFPNNTTKERWEEISLKPWWRWWRTGGKRKWTIRKFARWKSFKLNWNNIIQTVLLSVKWPKFSLLEAEKVNCTSRDFFGY